METEFIFNMDNLRLGTDASTPSVQSPPASPTVVDEEGDLYLVVGPAKRAFQVDSHALTRASRVWKSMLTGGWAESRPKQGAWVVQWPDDDPRAIEILLHIIHLAQSRVAQALNVDDLFHVAIIVDMYDLARCLGLWPDAWCKRIVASAVFRACDFEDLAKLAWIGWVFGNTVLFENVLHRMLVEVEVDGEGRLVDSAGMPLEEFKYLKAMDVLDHLATCRLQLVSNLLSVLVDSLATASAKTSIWSCRSNQLSSLRSDAARNKARADCNAAVLGSLVQELAAEDLFPLPSGPEDILESAQALKVRLTKVASSVQTLGIPGGGRDGAGGRNQIPAGHIDSTSHAGCSPSQRLVKQLDVVMSMAVCSATPSQARHLQGQARDIGGHR